MAPNEHTYLDSQEVLVMLHLAGYPHGNNDVIRYPGTGDRHDDATAGKATSALYAIRTAISGIEIEGLKFDASKIDGKQRECVKALDRFTEKDLDSKPIKGFFDLKGIMNHVGNTEKSARDIVIDGLAVIATNPLRQGFTLRLSEMVQLISREAFQMYLDSFMDDTLRNGTETDYYTFNIHRKRGFALIRERFDAFGQILILKEADFDRHFRFVEFVAAMHERHYLKIIDVSPFGKRDITFKVHIMKKLLDEETTNRAGKPTVKEIQTLDIPKGTHWEDIELKFANERDIEIYVLRKRFRKTNDEELGCCNRKTRRPDKQWEFFRSLSYNGSFNLTGRSIDDKERRKKQKEILSARLREAFGIEEEPISYDDLKKEYQTRFKILPEPDLRGNGELYLRNNRRSFE